MRVMESQECVTPESKTCTECGKTLPLDCFYRKGSRLFSKCKECTNEATRAKYLQNREVKLAKCAEYRKEKKAQIKQYMAAYYQKNRDEVLARCAEYRNRPESKEKESERQKMYYAARSAEIQARRKAAIEADPDRRARFNEYLKKHYLENKAYYISKGGKRRAFKLNATPLWANMDAIKRIYLLAEKISAETGIKHHVDHVIPLRGKKVCGLHVESNLQIIPETENKRKANKFIEG